MAGLYIHIPFCSSRCIYCGFYSTTRLELRQHYVDALCREMVLRKDEGRLISTIYIGGGTPSQLSVQQLHQLFDAVYNIYNVENDAEVTIECNPDDVSKSFAESLTHLSVNRVSMGAQTFSGERLSMLRRRHRPAQVPEAVDNLREAGISNISIDLIYGFPEETLHEWQADVSAALALGVEHLSAYALSYEEGTVLRQMLEAGRVEELDEEVQRKMYYLLKDRLEAAGYEHYEISNFALPGYRSRHNSSYWNHTPYIGLGAGAHSLTTSQQDGRPMVRQWNIDSLTKYIRAINEGHLPYDSEKLDETALYNDIIMTALRTREGLDLARISDAQRSFLMSQARRYIDVGWLSLKEGKVVLTRSGLFVSDLVMFDLMMV